ncbi:DUF742 domain-containing protein [Streptomyces sulphureus]|uniref:DUF742 domain-containing protein n=1 Tax=Streptomyces sulphureus TaxID=47758 RepID=UPI000368DEBF|nr:DUF742 domain-containing protein [Streptomyces sulphureus]
MTDRWFDDAAGPVVRPYAMTRGRTRSSTEEAKLDLIALVIADRPGSGTGLRDPGVAEAPEEAHTGAESTEDSDVHADRTLAPEHVEIVTRCRREPLSVAELSAALDLPLGVVRVLIGDLVDRCLVRVSRPVPPAELPDESILREVISGLKAL